MSEEENEVFDSGAVRSKVTERYDLLAPHAMKRLAETYAEGAEKYDDHNWLKGMPFSQTMNHALKHCFQYLSGDRSEDHLAHAAWGLLAMLEFDETRPELNDFFYQEK